MAAFSCNCTFPPAAVHTGISRCLASLEVFACFQFLHGTSLNFFTTLSDSLHLPPLPSRQCLVGALELYQRLYAV